MHISKVNSGETNSSVRPDSGALQSRAMTVRSQRSAHAEDAATGLSSLARIDEVTLSSRGDSERDHIVDAHYEIVHRAEPQTHAHDVLFLGMTVRPDTSYLTAAWGRTAGSFQIQTRQTSGLHIDIFA